jgi:hypothetical protein
MRPSNNNIIVRTSYYHFLFCFILCWQGAAAADFSGRFSMLGATAQAQAGDVGYQQSVGDVLSADQQGVRLMLEEGDGLNEWSAHLRAVRLHTHGVATADVHSSDLFRYAALGSTILDESDDTTATVISYQLDRLYYRRHLKNYSITLGRQAIDWGSGRFWQPLNLFGSFAPTDLDTDYKPGIDAVSIDYFPSPFSSLSGVYVFAPQDQSTVKDSAALYYRRQVGSVSEIALAAGTITGNTVVGGSFESAWKSIGWRIEGVHYQLKETDEQILFWIAGLDYQFDNGTLLSAEYYDNSHGADTESELVGMFSDSLVASGLQQHLSRHLIGIGLSHDLTPLLQGGYTLLASVLKANSDSNDWSVLHQFNLTYSVSNESDLLISLILPDGKGLSLTDEPRSEFGHIPASVSLRLRFYF